MEKNTILQADPLDILFDGRNKEYGAYQLRKTYNKRLFVALLLMFLLVALFVASNAFSKKDHTPTAVFTMISGDNILHEVPPYEIPEKAPEQPKARQQTESVKELQYSKPNIVSAEDVKTPPPSVEELQTGIIGLENKSGQDFDGRIHPPQAIEGESAPAVPAPKIEEEKGPLMVVEIQASFPGGAKKWSQYIYQAIMKRADEFDNQDYGTCIVKFVVDQNGKVSDVEATTMKGSRLAEIAVQAIRKGPDWVPAVQNGRKVSSYRLQPVTLREP